jgi:hypothetical protein
MDFLNPKSSTIKMTMTAIKMRTVVMPAPSRATASAEALFLRD